MATSVEGSIARSESHPTLPEPRVSIGLPVYDGEDFIAEQIESLLKQSFGDFELIIADNASTDRTQQICLGYSAQDPRIRYIRNATNVGPVANHNLLIDSARGGYFKFAAHDDIHERDFLARCIEVLDSDASVVLAYPQRVRFGGDEETHYLAFGADVSSTKATVRFRNMLKHPWSS
ncbi:MAG: glycosyltransferase family 2 protein, partial [Acidimicrobiia bacterium]